MIRKVRDIIKTIEDDGWQFHRQRGSHMQYKHPEKRGKVTIPNHGLNEYLGHNLVKSILTQAELWNE
ncbi:MAG: type II toxin-antitoxin system HicA family toxin [Prevotellaceae bacterium]|jgi:predicted RNA binding protein YcfA (HicA-like mRNA interferase family)|nr:type II toxin-antitoxin system HicA family toxin [Prevotellaceae bacterium]